MSSASAFCLAASRRIFGKRTAAILVVAFDLAVAVTRALYSVLRPRQEILYKKLIRRISGFMGGQKRQAGQEVDSFSAPTSLLEKARRKAIMKGMTKSGFYRYCLAKECGFSEEEATALGQHRAPIVNMAKAAAMNERKSPPYGQSQSQADK